MIGVGGREQTADLGGPAAGYVFDWFARYWLGVWFGVVSGLWFYLNLRNGTAFPGDDQYLAATNLWLAGGDPWSTPVLGGWFGAPPITFLPLVPFAVIPYGRWLLIVVAFVAAVLTVRRLGLPWYWMLFPPLVNAWWGGAIDAWLPLLILSGHGWLAVLGKVYAAVPLAILGRWRPLVIAGVIIALTYPFLPWGSYVAQFPAISERLAMQAADLSAPLYLVPVVLVCLFLMGRQKAAWMAVPALWPSTQFYYGAMALPALTPVAAAVMAIPSPWTTVGACVVLAWYARR